MMTQQLFDDMIGSPPASTVDLDAIIAKERRHIRRRTATATLAVAVAGLLIGSGVLVANRTPTTPPDVGSSLSSADIGGESTVRRLSEALRQAVRREAPAAELSRLGGAELVEPLTVTYRSCGSANPPQQLPMEYYASAGIRVGEHAGALNVEMGSDIRDLECGRGPGPLESLGTATTGPDGQKVLTSEEPGAHRISVVVRRTDGSYVALLHSARWPDLTSASTSLTVEQLTRIALDPALRL